MSCYPIHVYSEADPTIFNGAYFLVNTFRTEALQSVQNYVQNVQDLGGNSLATRHQTIVP